MNLSKSYWVFVFLVICFASLEANAFEPYRRGWIKPSAAIVYKDFQPGAIPMANLPSGREVKIYKKKGTRLLIRYQRGGSWEEGWAEHSDVRVGEIVRPGSPKVLTPAPTEEDASSTGPTEEKASTETNPTAPFQMQKGLSLRGGRTMDACKLGLGDCKFDSAQWRVGIEHQHDLTDRFSLLFPLDFSFGDGFYTIRTAAALSPRLWRGKIYSLELPIGFAGEYLFGNGKSFTSGQFQFGMRFHGVFSEHYKIGVDALSLEWGVLNTEEVPSFLRVYTGVLFGYLW